MQAAGVSLVAMSSVRHGHAHGGPAVVIRETGRVPLRLLLGDAAIEVGRDCAGVLLTDPQISRRHLSLTAVGEAVRRGSQAPTPGGLRGDPIVPRVNPA